MQFIIPQQRNQPKCRNLRSTGTPQLLCPSLHHLTLPEGLGSWARAPDGEPLPSLKWAHAGLWGNSQGVAQGTEHHPPIPQQTGSHDLVHCPQVADNLNMQRQAVPLLISEAPLVGTGLEEAAARNSSLLVKAEHNGEVTYVDAERIVITYKEAGKNFEETHVRRKFVGLNERTCQNQKPLV